ncbi:hypothetical protein YC2023_045102 [Brassica napus]
MGVVRSCTKREGSPARFNPGVRWWFLAVQLGVCKALPRYSSWWSVSPWRGGSTVPCLFRSIVLGGWPNTKRASISVESLIIGALMTPGSFVPVIIYVPPSGYPAVGCPSLSIRVIDTSKGRGFHWSIALSGARSGGAGARKEDGYRRVGAQADPPTDVGGENPGKLGEQKPGAVYQRGRKQLGGNYLGSCVWERRMRALTGEKDLLEVLTGDEGGSGGSGGSGSVN